MHRSFRLQLRRLLAGLGVVLVSLAYATAPALAGLSASQKQALQGDTKYFNTEDSPYCDNGASGIAAGSGVYILGDSITERSKDAYASAFQQRGMTALVNGVAGRSINGPGLDGDKSSGMDAVSNDASVIGQGTTAAIVIALGTNGGNNNATVTQIVTAIRAKNQNAKLFWIDTTVINRPGYVPTIKAANQAIYDNAATLDYQPISWYQIVTPAGDPRNPSGSETDNNKYIVDGDEHVHPTQAGITALTSAVAQAVTKSLVGGTTVDVQTANSCVCVVGGPLVGNDNIAKIYNYLLGKQLQPFQIAGIMGNMQAESGFNPSRVEIRFSDPPHLSDTIPPNIGPHGEPGYGIVQWTGGRKDTLRAYAKQTGRAENDLGMQLDFFWQELTTRYKPVFDDIKGSTTYQQVTDIFLRRFEVAGNPDGTLPDRLKFAAQILSTYGASGAATGGTISLATNGCGSPNSDFLNNFIIYNQFDPRWGGLPYGTDTVAESGCGPSAMAMIITALTGQSITPADTSKLANELHLYGVGPKGSFSLWTIGPGLAKANPAWGLTATKIHANVTEISAALRSGSLVITAGAGALPFTKNGHFIVIRGITDSGMFRIGDSGHKDTSGQDWDPQTIINGIFADGESREGSVYAISRQAQ